MGHATMNAIHFSFCTVTPDWIPTLSYLHHGQAIRSEGKYSIKFCYKTIVVSLWDLVLYEITE
jgi:hypothetical protein